MTDVVPPKPRAPLEGIPEDRTALIEKITPYLENTGWFRSAASKTPVDARGRPLPWYTYASIHFLGPRIKADMSVFEFGCGNSTRWWAARAKSVDAVEHSPVWAVRMQEATPDHINIRFVELSTDGDYCRAAKALSKRFDVIVIDGRDRVNCAYNSLEALSGRGVVVWDNANRPRYAEGLQFLQDNGFKRIDFRSHGPINSAEGQTTVFYREGNCLGI